MNDKRVRSLQQLIDKVVKGKNRYGRDSYYDPDTSRPLCPLTVEVLPDKPSGSIVSAAVLALHCTHDDIDDFTTWWDVIYDTTTLHEETIQSAIEAAKALRKRGYNVPTRVAKFNWDEAKIEVGDQ